MAKAADIPDLAADMAFREAAARAVEVRTEELFGHGQGVLDTDDIERVHDMRVASRRLRAVLEIFSACFPKQEYRVTLKEVKALADALGERRDPDVAIAALSEIESGLTDDDRPGIESLIGEFRERQAGGNEAVAAMLVRIEETELRPRLLALAEAARAG
jgi:CHAD domain-containing protein